MDYRLDASKKVLPTLKFYAVIYMHITLDLVQTAAAHLFHKEWDLVQELGSCHRWKDSRSKNQRAPATSLVSSRLWSYRLMETGTAVASLTPAGSGMQSLADGK